MINNTKEISFNNETGDYDRNNAAIWNGDTVIHPCTKHGQRMTAYIVEGHKHNGDILWLCEYGGEELIFSSKNIKDVEHKMRQAIYDKGFLGEIEFCLITEPN